MPDIPVSPLYLCLVAAFAFVVLPLGILQDRPREITRRLRRDLGAEALPEAVFTGFFLLWVVLCALLFGGLISSLFDLVSELVLTDPADRSEKAKVNFRFFLAGIAALTATLGATLAIPVTLFRLRYSQQANETAQNGLIADRLHKAMEALAKDKTVKIDGEEFSDPNVEVRYAALLTLDTLYKEGNPQFTKENYNKFLHTYLFTNLPVPSKASQVDTKSTQLRSDLLLAFEHLVETKGATSLNLQGITFPEQHVLPELHLIDIWFNVSDISNCVFVLCKFDDITFSGVDLEGSTFVNSIFKNCLFGGSSSLRLKRVTGCTFVGCALRNIDLSEEILNWLNPSEFFADASVSLPDQAKRPSHWSDEKLSDRKFEQEMEEWRTACSNNALTSLIL
ncbi:pentapeptide repeat-containing protein [Rhodobacteraceae bacterium R_SAG3]|nr:pentapeptide repeat-containing protein [Rhodobacteraceae bacterium R_SAG3]